MRKWITLVLAGIFCMAAVVGCGSKEPTANAPAGTQTPTQTQTETKPEGSSELSTIMKSASQVKGMSFDMVMTMSTSDNQSIVSNGKMYVQDEKVRMEMESMGMKIITLMNTPEEVYLYTPATNSAMKMTTPQEGTEPPNSWARESGDTTGMTVVGEEKKDGYDCLVVTMADDSDTKMWIRKDIGMPVLMESKTDEGTMVIEYKNYNLAAQPDNLFELPAGTQITSMPVLPNVPQ